MLRKGQGRQRGTFLPSSSQRLFSKPIAIKGPQASPRIRVGTAGRRRMEGPTPCLHRSRAAGRGPHTLPSPRGGLPHAPSPSTSVAGCMPRPTSVQAGCRPRRGTWADTVTHRKLRPESAGSKETGNIYAAKTSSQDQRALRRPSPARRRLEGGPGQGGKGWPSRRQAGALCPLVTCLLAAGRAALPVGNVRPRGGQVPTARAVC